MNTNELTKSISQSSIVPAVKYDVNLKEYRSLPLAEISSLGMGFEPVVGYISAVVGNGGSGLYHVEVPKGFHLASFKDGTGYLGTALNNTTNQVGAQATLTPVMDPTMLIVSLAISAITDKLNDCIQIGEAVLKRLDAAEKAKITGSINFMNDVYREYKYKWNNTRYIESSLTTCKGIRSQAEISIELQRSLIKDELKESGFLKKGKTVIKKYNSIISALKNYQLALYMRAFAYFLEVLFEENFDLNYLKAVSDNIYKYSLEYKEIYTDCFNYIEDYNKSSFKSNLICKSSSVSKHIGKAVNKVPLVSKTQIDENLIELGEKLGTLNDTRNESLMQDFSELRNEYSKEIRQSVEYISDVFNKETQLLFDDKNVYYKIEG